VPADEIDPARTIAHYIEPMVTRAKHNWALNWQRVAASEPPKPPHPANEHATDASRRPSAGLGETQAISSGSGPPAPGPAPNSRSPAG
jgi:hypothetical protein